MSDGRPIFLVGFMGSGKTAAAAALATRLGWEAVDTDRLVEEREGRSIQRIFDEAGEGHFRGAEQEALESLAGRKRIVVATGGGLFLGAAQRRFVRREGHSVWLDVTLSCARRRVGGGDARPLWLPDDPLSFRAFFEKRRAVYALADARVDATTLDPDGVAEAILDRVPEVSH